MLLKCFLVAVFTTIVALMIGLYSSKAAPSHSEQTSRQVTEEEINNAVGLRQMALQALAEGRTKLDISNHSVGVPAYTNLDQTLNEYTVVLGQPVDYRSVLLDDYSIGTWYKFRVRDTLSEKPDCLPNVECLPLPEPPEDMYLQQDEIFVLRNGGTQIIEGVKVTVHEPNFTDLSFDQEYLLFINYEADRKVALLPEPAGVFILDNEYILTPIYAIDEEYAHPLDTDLKIRFASSFTALKNFLTPSPCDPVQRRRCVNSGGFWDDVRCRCNWP
jgi:hypothetical protein